MLPHGSTVVHGTDITDHHAIHQTLNFFKRASQKLQPWLRWCCTFFGNCTSTGERPASDRCFFFRHEMLLSVVPNPASRFFACVSTQSLQHKFEIKGTLVSVPVTKPGSHQFASNNHKHYAPMPLPLFKHNRVLYRSFVEALWFPDGKE